MHVLPECHTWKDKSRLWISECLCTGYGKNTLVLGLEWIRQYCDIDRKSWRNLDENLDIVNNQPQRAQMISCPLWFRWASYRVCLPCRYLYKWCALTPDGLQTTDHWDHATGPQLGSDDSSGCLLQGEKCCVCSISPSLLLCPNCLGLLFAKLPRQVELGRGVHVVTSDAASELLQHVTYQTAWVLLL